MKTIRKNVMVLTLALFGLGIIGNNVLYGTDEMYPDPGGGGGGSYTCYFWPPPGDSAGRHCIPYCEQFYNRYTGPGVARSTCST